MDHKYLAKNSQKGEGKLLKVGSSEYKGKRLKQKPSNGKEKNRNINNKNALKDKHIVEANVPTIPNLYKPQSKMGTRIEFLVVNLMPQLDLGDLTMIINAIKQYCDSSFATVWGCSAVFQILPFGTYPTNTQLEGRAIIYLADQIIGGSSNFSGAIAAHWLVMPPPYDSIDGDGPQPSYLVNIIPKIPPNTIVLMVPYGDGTYGLSAEMHKNQGKLIDTLGIALSHEVFETLIDPYPIGYGASYQVYVGSNYTFMYVKEVCDPVQDSLASNINGITMSNFLYPAYFNPLSPPGTQLDQNNQINSPLTPYRGSQFGLLVDNKLGGMSLFIDVSDPINPSNVIRYKMSEIYSPCVSRSVMRHLKETVRLFRGAQIEPSAILDDATIIDRVVIDTSIIPLVIHN
jgi:hypothetical protein